MAEPLYDINSLRFGYSGIPVLDIPELSLHEGMVHVLLGPNGSGKTTLLKLLNRLLPAQSGETESGRISFQGEALERSRAVRERTVYVHQNPLLLSGTVFDNVAYGLTLRTYRRKTVEKLVMDTLLVVGLKGFERRKSNALSGGEIQRVAIARALVLEPQVLLLDEPTASVDRQNVGRIETLLKQIKDTYGCTIIISTHNLPFAYRMCDRLIHMDEGRICPSYENILKGRIIGRDSDRHPRGPASDDGRGVEGTRIDHDRHSESEHLFLSGGLTIACPQLEGVFSTAVIDYDRVILSKERLETSARNCFSGRIESISPVPGTAEDMVDISIRVDMDPSTENPVDPRQQSSGIQKRGSDGISIISRITTRSCTEMDLHSNDRIYLAFKASSVRLY